MSIDRFLSDFTGKDYSSLVTLADQYLTELIPEWRDRDDHDINWATAKAVAFLVSIGMMNIDLAYSESDPSSTQIYKNMLRLAKIVGYPVNKYIGATTSLDLTLDALSSTYLLEKGTTFGSYTNFDDLYIAAGETSARVNVIYGTFFTDTLGVSTGKAFQTFTISREDIESKMVRIYVDDIEYEIRTNLFNSYEDETHCRMVLTEDNLYEIQFGDNYNGKIPPNNAVITYEAILMPSTYLNDDYGNIPVGNITKCSDSTITSVTQNYVASGGGDKDNIDTIGKALLQWATTSGRIQSTRDAEILAKTVAGVGDAVCEYDGTYNIYIIPTGGGVASPALLSKVSTELTPLVIEDVSINIFSPTYKAIDITVSIVVKTKYHRSTVKSLVADSIKAYINNTTDIARFIPEMDITALYDISSVKTGTLDKLCESGGTGVADIQLGLEIATVGTITVNATGGFV